VQAHTQKRNGYASRQKNVEGTTMRKPISTEAFTNNYGTGYEVSTVED
jgi:hypothetical protein